MTTIFVPRHLDEPLSDDSVPHPAGIDVVTVDIDLPDGDEWQRLAALYDVVAEKVAAHIGLDGKATVVSGDCLVAMPSIVGAQRAGLDPSIVWLDAHGDLHTPQTSTSGYIGGMPLRLILGAHPQLLGRPLGLRAVSEDRAVLVDARDLDPAESEFLATSQVRLCPVADLDDTRVPDGSLVMHIDVDVIDAAQLPGLRYPVGGGPSTRDVIASVSRVLDTGRVVSLSIACPWHPAANAREQDIRAELLAGLLRLVS